MDYLRQNIARSSANLPRSVAFLPYKLLFTLIRALSGLPDDKLWLRNSLALDYWELGLSDLDLSLYSKGGSSEAAALWSRFQGFRFLSLGGEVQVYSETQLERLLTFCNYFEAQRDPKLSARMATVKRTAHPLEANVFLIKMLMSDKGLRRSPELRHRKWERMIGLLERPPLNSVSMRSVYEELYQHSLLRNTFSSDELWQSIETPHEGSLRAQLVLEPNKVVITAERLPRLVEALSQLPRELHGLISMHQRWEIWGLSCLTPITHGFSKENLFHHISNQVALTGLLNIEKSIREELCEGFEVLREYYGPLDF